MKHTGKLSSHEKRKARRAKERLANGLAKSNGEEIPFPKKRKPPEPKVAVWFDWARESGRVLHCGRRKLKYRMALSSETTRGAEIIGTAVDEKTRQLKYLVLMPVSLALDIFGKA